VEVEDWFQVEESVVAFVLVFAAVVVVDSVVVSTATGVVAVVDVVVMAGSVEDLVLLLQPLRTSPAKIKVNNIVVFIGGFSFAPTDPSRIDRFTTHLARFCHRFLSLME
jgi:hypothetical protein